MSKHLVTDITPTERVILWTAPRCVSCAFERSLRTLKTAQVVHEAYSLAYYFGPERQSTRYQTSPVDPTFTYTSVNLSLQKDYEGKKLVFAKEMAYCVENKFEMFLEDKFKGVQHTFLIRNPEKALCSLYKLCTNFEKTGWDHFNPVEAGFRQMYQLYEFLQHHELRVSAVIDADDLLASPQEMMKMYCKAVGVTFEEGMMTWESGFIPEWCDYWPGWYDEVVKTSGFEKKVPASNSINLSDFPAEVHSAIEESRMYYDKLYEVRMKTPKT